MSPGPVSSRPSLTPEGPTEVYAMMSGPVPAGLWVQLGAPAPLLSPVRWMIPHPEAVPPLVEGMHGGACPPCGGQVVPALGGAGFVPQGATGRPAPMGAAVPVHWRSIHASCGTTPVWISGSEIEKAFTLDPSVVMTFRSVSE